ncbi:hypothetical protein [Egicoccus sp. AB-alg2]|uniref:hypothetical protein n=1 Tax=Egicoccus sp. AB-alg2 TaxID=3242693 RepID=UPI00359DAE83
MNVSTGGLPVERRIDGVEARRATWAGTAVRVLDVAPGGDLQRLGTTTESGLCPVDHWGVVLEGRVDVRFAFGERETASAGDIFFWPALHRCWSEQGARLVEFSRSADLDAAAR